MAFNRRALLGLLLASAAAPALAQTPARTRYWPVVTDHPQALEISGDATSRPLRRFNAPRPAVQADNPTRRHAGVDLFARPGDLVVAVEDGRIVGFYPFLRARTGEMSYALLVAHETFVANYGEVREASLRSRGLSVGDTVTAGSVIADVSDTAQLHFEIYAPGTTRNQSWPHGAPQPDRVRDPTRLLAELSRTAVRLQPARLVSASE
jgi:murein DD-endopeptidase MepM/ murein hydrolase activator NlpD